jgi:hypothetical protein
MAARLRPIRALDSELSGKEVYFPAGAWPRHYAIGGEDRALRTCRPAGAVVYYHRQRGAERSPFHQIFIHQGL